MNAARILGSLSLVFVLASFAMADPPRGDRPVLRAALDAGLRIAAHEMEESRHRAPPVTVIDPGFAHHHHHHADAFTDDRLGVTLAPTPGGLLVLEVGSGRPAARAGLETGDVILRMQTHEVDCRHDFDRHLASCTDHVDLYVRNVRTGRIVELCVHLGRVDRSGDLCGEWRGELGLLRIEQRGDGVRGTLVLEGTGERLTLVGRRSGNHIDFQWYRNERSFGVGHWDVTEHGWRLSGDVHNEVRGTIRDFCFERL